MSTNDPHPALTPEQVQRIARLARIELSPDRANAMSHDLARVVTYVERLKALDLAGVEPMTNVGDGTNRLAEDEPGPAMSAETLARMAPEHDGPFVRVPKVLDDSGGGA